MRFDRAKVQVLNCGKVEPDPSWWMSKHQHDHFEMVYFLSGRGHIQISGDTMYAHLYNLAIFPPGVPHEEKSDPEAPEETIFIGADLKSIDSGSEPVLLCDESGELRWLFERIYEEHTNELPNWRQLVHDYFMAVLLLIERRSEESQISSCDMVAQIMQYIEHNFTRDISIEELASFVHVTPAHLIRTFSEQVGTSPMKYLREFRVQIAKRMLLANSDPVNEIATAVGYDDASYFSRVFKKATGFSPTSFRSLYSGSSLVPGD